jgi:hypothetical protein
LSPPTPPCILPTPIPMAMLLLLLMPMLHAPCPCPCSCSLRWKIALQDDGRNLKVYMRAARDGIKVVLAQVLASWVWLWGCGGVEPCVLVGHCCVGVCVWDACGSACVWGGVRAFLCGACVGHGQLVGSPAQSCSNSCVAVHVPTPPTLLQLTLPGLSAEHVFDSIVSIPQLLEWDGTFQTVRLDR